MKKNDSINKILCNCPCPDPMCTSLVHPCKKPNEHYLQRDEAVYEIRKQAQIEILEDVLAHSSGGGSWRRVIEMKLATLKQSLEREGEGK